MKEKERESWPSLAFNTLCSIDKRLLARRDDSGRIKKEVNFARAYAKDESLNILFFYKPQPEDPAVTVVRPPRRRARSLHSRHPFFLAPCESGYFHSICSRLTRRFDKRDPSAMRTRLSTSDLSCYQTATAVELHTQLTRGPFFPAELVALVYSLSFCLYIWRRKMTLNQCSQFS